MEFYTIYHAIAENIWRIELKDYSIVPTVQSIYLALLITVGVWGTLFLLQAFAIFTMARRRGVGGSWKAFLPFLNILYMGKIAGDCTVFGQKIKHVSLYTMIAQILLTALSAIEVAGMVYLWTAEGAPSFRWIINGKVSFQVPNENAFFATVQPVWLDLQGGASVLNNYIYVYNDIIRVIVQMVYEIMMFILLKGIYKQYAPNNHFVLSMVSLFFPISRYIVLFVLRNREPVDYQAYIRQQWEAYMRSRGFTVRTPNGSSQSDENVTMGQAMGEDTTKEPEEPFDEFSNPKQNESDGDEFFS